MTLLVDPAGAEALALSEHEGKIHLVLRNPEDQETTQVASLSTRQMLGQAPIAKNTPAPRVRVAGPRTAPTQVAVVQRPAKEQKIRIIRSASVSETPAVSDSTTN